MACTAEPVQAVTLQDQDEQAQQLDKLAECDQMLKSGPGGDMSSLLKIKSRPFILTLLLGKQLPLHTGTSHPELPCPSSSQLPTVDLPSALS